MNSDLPATIYIRTSTTPSKPLGDAILAIISKLDSMRYNGTVCICGIVSGLALQSLRKGCKNLRFASAEEFPLPDKAVSYKCELPFSSMFINPSGECVLCHIDKNSSVKLGDALAEGIGAVWTGERYVSVRHAHENGLTDTLPLCSFCPLIQHPPKMAEKDSAQFDNEFDNVPEGKYAP